MSIIKIKAIDQALKITNAPMISAGDIKTDYVKFEFDSNWDGYGKTAVFYRDDNKENVYEVALDLNNQAIVPREVTQQDGKIWVGVVGVKGNGEVKTSEVIWYEIVDGVYTGAMASRSEEANVYKIILQAIESMKAAVGSPLVASTAAAMTDQTKIYVYTGSESGYTNGNWYYYNGSNWVSGGVYNSFGFETDKTLSVEDMAADAKATGNMTMRARGNVIALGYSTIAQCVDIGYYVFTTEQAPTIEDLPEGWTTGGTVIVYPLSNEIVQTLVSGREQYIRYNVSDSWRTLNNTQFNDINSQIEQINEEINEATNAEKIHVVYSNQAGDGASTESIKIYIPTYGRFVAYDFVHTVDSDINANVWRIQKCMTASANYAAGVDLTKLGEWECAIKLVGRDDFSGGYLHGDELQSIARFYADGKSIDPTTITSIQLFKEFRVYVTSILYDPANHTTQIAEHGKMYVFDKNGIRIEQSVKWLVDAQIAKAYLAMFPFAKIAGAKYFTNAYYAMQLFPDPDYSLTYDAATSISSNANQYGLRADFSILNYPGMTNGSKLLITDNGGYSYHKQYFVIPYTSAAAGDIWTATTKYNIIFNMG